MVRSKGANDCLIVDEGKMKVKDVIGTIELNWKDIIPNDELKVHILQNNQTMYAN